MAHLDHHMEFSVKFLSRSDQKLPNETDFYELITLNPNFNVLNVLQITIFTSVEVFIWPENKLRIQKFILFCEKFHTKRRPFWLKTIFLNQKSEMGKFLLKFEELDASNLILTRKIENNLHINRFQRKLICFGSYFYFSNRILTESTKCASDKYS